MNFLPKLVLKPFTHREQEVVQLLFERNDEIIRLLRLNQYVRWSKTMNCWYVPFSTLVVQQLIRSLNQVAVIDYNELKKNEQEVIVEQEVLTKRPQHVAHKSLGAVNAEILLKVEEFKRWMRSRRYSDNTVGTYSDALTTFLRYFSEKPIGEIKNEDVIDFNNEYILKNKFSSSFQNQVVNAIKLFFRTVEMKSLSPELIHRPKRHSVLPNVLSKGEVELILRNTRNLKHKAALALIYSCGLRRSELLNLKIKDINSGRNLLLIKMAKGKKDRVSPLSEKMIELLRKYYIAYKPKHYLFEGWVAGEQYSEKSLQNVLKNSVSLAGINKPVSLHWLRHSYATHLLEKGTDLRYIQEILGHKSSRTTEIYTHVSNKELARIITPFDDLQI